MKNKTTPRMESLKRMYNALLNDHTVKVKMGWSTLEMFVCDEGGFSDRNLKWHPPKDYIIYDCWGRGASTVSFKKFCWHVRSTCEIAKDNLHGAIEFTIE